MTLSIIVAMSNNRAIGKDNNLLWHLPEDLKYFKRITMGKPIIMGRKTFESIGRPLSGRLNIVVTRQTDWQQQGVKIVHSIEQALKLAQAQSVIDGLEEVMVIGGAEIYRTCLPQTDRLYLTRVDANLDGDAFFPEILDNQWQEIARESFVACEHNPYNYDFCVLERV